MNYEISKNKGITLVALVITIIVLLILAGVSIAALSGNNGILKKASEAKINTEISQEKEGISIAISTAKIGNENFQELNQETLQDSIDKQFGKEKALVTDNGNGIFAISFLESKRDYSITSKGIEESIDWSAIFKTAKAPENQKEERNKGVIGIGTDGISVNMDLWEYTLMEDNTYVLNDSIDANNAGYLGELTENGEIIGKIPQYISTDNGINYIKVTSLRNLFREITNLKIAPELPKTVKNLFCVFSQTSITEAPIIPSGVINMDWAFEVTKLQNMPYIPNGIESMVGTFSACTELKEVRKISKSVTNLHFTFAMCTKLEEVLNEFEIPENVTNINQIFWKCKELKKIPNNFKIPKNVTDICQAFGECSALEGNILLDSSPTQYINWFQVSTNNKLVVNYTNNCTNINDILRYSGGGNVQKGDLIN